MASGCAWVLAPFAAAHASGFSTPRFGQEHGHPTTDNPTAIYYNPAGIALGDGTRIFADGTLGLRWARVDRPAAGPDDVAPGSSPVQNSQQTLQLAPGANNGRASLFNAFGVPFFGVSSDFGTEFIAAGAAVYMPFALWSKWDANNRYANNPDFPGAVDGPQRWHEIATSLHSIYLTGALAFNIRKIGLAIGLSGSAIRTAFSTTRAYNVDGTDDLVIGTPRAFALKEGRSHIDTRGWQGGFGIGLVYDVAKRGRYFIGASYTSEPNVAGGMTLRGKRRTVVGLDDPTEMNVDLEQHLPDVVRLGVRVRPTDRYELRLFADYTRWSVFESQCILDRSVPDRACSLTGDGSPLDDPEAYGAPVGDRGGIAENLPRMFKDAGGVHLGASYWFVPPLEGYLGFGFDSSAVPQQTLSAASFDAAKFNLAAGFRWQVIDQFAFAFTVTEQFFVRTSTEGKSVLGRFMTPSRQPSGDGVYRQFRQLFSLYVDAKF